jgi:hypothetical protein
MVDWDSGLKIIPDSILRLSNPHAFLLDVGLLKIVYCGFAKYLGFDYSKYNLKGTNGCILAVL